MAGKKGEYRTILETAMALEEKCKKVSLLRHAIKRAYEDDTVLIAIIGKLLPSLKSIDMKSVGDSPFRLIIDLSERTTTKRIKSKVSSKRHDIVKIQDIS